MLQVQSSRCWRSLPPRSCSNSSATKRPELPPDIRSVPPEALGCHKPVPGRSHLTSQCTCWWQLCFFMPNFSEHGRCRYSLEISEPEKKRPGKRKPQSRVFLLREEDDGWNSIQDAQNAVATLALFKVSLCWQTSFESRTLSSICHLALTLTPKVATLKNYT